MKRKTHKKHTKKLQIMKEFDWSYEHIKALRFRTCWLLTLFMSSLFGSDGLTIIKRRLIVWWLLLAYCFAGNKAGKNSFTCLFNLRNRF